MNSRDVLGGLVFLAALAPAWAGAATVEVTAARLNIRSGPSSRSAVVGSAPRGQKLSSSGTQGSWTRVNFKGRDAWAFGRYLKTVPDPVSSTPGAPMTVTAAALNVRSGPSTRNARLGSLQRGARVEVFAESGVWRQIRFNGRDAWVHGGFLAPVATGGSGSGGGQTLFVSASSLNVRSGPGTRFRRLGSLSFGNKVTVTGQDGVWRQIAFRDGEAWVHGDFLSADLGDTPQNLPRSRRGFVQLPTSARDYFGYYAASKRWGTPRMVYGIIRIARRFRSENPGVPRVPVGDISLMNGGDISGHASHELGVDADLRPIRHDGREGRVTIHQSPYSRTLTRRLIDLFYAELPVTHVFFNDRRIPRTQAIPNHDNHFHVRIRR